MYTLPINLILVVTIKDIVQEIPQFFSSFQYYRHKEQWWVSQLFVSDTSFYQVLGTSNIIKLYSLVDIGNGLSEYHIILRILIHKYSEKSQS